MLQTDNPTCLLQVVNSLFQTCSNNLVQTVQRHFDNNDHLCADLGRSYACSLLQVNAACVLILERRHEWYRASLDHVLTEKMDDIRESDEDDLGASSHSGDELGNRNKPEADQISSEGFVSTDSDVPTPRELLWSLDLTTITATKTIFLFLIFSSTNRIRLRFVSSFQEFVFKIYCVENKILSSLQWLIFNVKIS